MFLFHLIELDDSLMEILVTKETQHKVATEMKKIFYQQQQRQQQEDQLMIIKKKKIWWIQRLYCFTLALITSLIAFYPVQAGNVNIWKAITRFQGDILYSGKSNYISCGAHIYAAGFSSAAICQIFYLIENCIVQRNWKIIVQNVIGSFLLNVVIWMCTVFLTGWLWLRT